jgi:hypothetical protein
MRDPRAPFQRPSGPNFTNPLGGAPAGAGPILPAGTIAAQTGEKEYSFLKTAKIHAACGFDSAHWETNLLTLYIQMLEEDRTTTHASQGPTKRPFLPRRYL